MCISRQGHANGGFRPGCGQSRCGNDRSRSSGWCPDGLCPAWPGGLRSLLLTKCDGEKKSLSQQQCNGFPHEGPAHRPAYYYKKAHLKLVFSVQPQCSLCLCG